MSWQGDTLLVPWCHFQVGAVHYGQLRLENDTFTNLGVCNGTHTYTRDVPCAITVYISKQGNALGLPNLIYFEEDCYYYNVCSCYMLLLFIDLFMLSYTQYIPTPLMYNYNIVINAGLISVWKCACAYSLHMWHNLDKWSKWNSYELAMQNN